MKKYYYLIIATLTALLLTACGSPAIQPTADATVSTVPISPVTPDTIPPESTIPTQEEAVPMVLVENESICVKITGVENDPIWGYTMNVYLENKTDKDLLFTVDNVSVNRYMCDPFWAESVAAGMKSNSSISWFESEFEENGISSVEEINFTLRVYDSKNFSAEDVFQGSFRITP